VRKLREQQTSDVVRQTPGHGVGPAMLCTVRTLTVSQQSRGIAEE
jgi:hypothetical protein